MGILFLSSLHNSVFRQFYHLAPKIENKLSRILCLDLSFQHQKIWCYICEWTPEQRVNRPQIFLGAEMVDTLYIVQKRKFCFKIKHMER